ncbi:hypothetical protein [Paenibacillus sp. FSL H7-0703]
MIAQGVLNYPQAELVLMEKYSLFMWGETSEAAYVKTIIDICNTLSSIIGITRYPNWGRHLILMLIIWGIC